MQTEISSRRIPWVALVLSFLSPGVGHLYCGRIIKALPLYFAWTLVLLCTTVAALLQASVTTLVLLVLMPGLAVLIVYLYAAFDAWRIAHQIGSDYSLRDYNRAAFYLLFILVYNLYPIGLIAGVRGLVYEPYLIPVSNMSPTILAGDRILARKLSPTKQSPDRGDLIVYHNPTPKGATRFIGRVVAVAGDQLVIDGERLLINGNEVERVRIPDENLKLLGDQVRGTVAYEQNSGRSYLVAYEGSAPQGSEPNDLRETIPEGHVFVLGDNRDRSRDSRHFGSIDAEEIVGYVDYIYWPSTSWSRFGVTDESP